MNGAVRSAQLQRNEPYLGVDRREKPDARDRASVKHVACVFRPAPDLNGGIQRTAPCWYLRVTAR